MLIIEIRAALATTCVKGTLNSGLISVSVMSGMMIAMRGRQENSLRKPSFFIKK
jgi:hypothetical protein